MLSVLKRYNPKIYDLLMQERERQSRSLRLIPSENYASAAVMEATGSWLTNKYSEGYPGKRYYEGQQITDQIETLAIERAKRLFALNMPTFSRIRDRWRILQHTWPFLNRAIR